LTPTGKRVRWGGVRVYEIEPKDEAFMKQQIEGKGKEKCGKRKRDKENVERTQRDVPPKEKEKEKEIWGPVSENDIWQAGPWAGIWGPCEEE
jgi:hypothetical protein